MYLKKPDKFSEDIISAGCFISYQKKILFLQKAITRWNAKKWGMPCGRIEENENVHEALLREVKEETNLTLKSDFLQYLGDVFVVSLERIQYTFHIFSYKLEQKEKIKISEEHMDFKWIFYKEIQNLNLISFQKEIFDYFLGSKLN